MSDLLQEAKQVLRTYNLRPRHSLGQNFLVNEQVLDDIVVGAELNSEDTVVEVGPGLGFLTRKLAARVKELYLYEVDQNFVKILESEYRDQPQVHVFNESALEYTPPECSYSIVANIPYYLTSAFIKRHLEEVSNSPSAMILMIQKEVAKEIVAAKGKMSLLAVSVHTFADAEIILDVPRDNFYPAPNVDSSVIRIYMREEKFDADYLKTYFRIVKTGFSKRRKQLTNTLLPLFTEKSEMLAWLEQSGIAPMRRAETLTIDEWHALAKLYIERNLH